MIERLDVPEGHTVLLVGDLHGHYGRLIEALRYLGYLRSRTRPRLFENITLVSLGDLVDRGPDSARLVNLFTSSDPGYKMVRGNHEQMVIDSGHCEDTAELHKVNGGRWFHDLEPDAQVEIRTKLARVPVAMEIRFSEASVVGAVHAEVPVLAGVTWSEWLNALDREEGLGELTREELVEKALWGREVSEMSKAPPVPGIDLVAMGHTAYLRGPRRDGNRLYLDTRAYQSEWPNCYLTLLALSVEEGELTQELLCCSFVDGVCELVSAPNEAQC
ncbi:metallophosphoesterase [Ferrimonas marina]|uniref:Serine/threonine protein phosphatase 1 n=1 Tax=Ferrimonas marina TaxID=299255 RepID=A0A1M5UK83_9GAMM|nr:metallophosphoesterase [Ferrimonas marina]SHH63452.1 serine/threonine protein phosphatase 1 [Ferrimonas marina]